jgi:hypothetical protein
VISLVWDYCSYHTCMNNLIINWNWNRN